VPRGELLAPARFIRDERLTVWFSVPSVVALLRKARLLRPGAFPALRLSSFCGEPLPLASIEAWRAAAPASAIENQYGPTEATISCTAERWSDGAPAVTEGRGTVAIGRPYEGTLAGIVDEALRFVAPGTPGELVLAGPQLAAGYLDDPELTARRFPTLAHPRHGEGRWYRTGDLAVEDEGGRLHHLGRIDHQVKILGKRVELEDIEANLRAACGTASVAAVAWPVEAGVAQGVVAFVAAGERDEEVVKSRMRARVPAHMVPRRVVPVGDLPLTANGKLDRKLLVALLDAGAAAGRAPANGGVEREAA
jgi:acyl-CoA synthetase (AMP-forming)/AMP-acid ligase II